VGLLRCYFTLTIGDIISHAGKQAQTGIRIPFRNAGGQGNKRSMSTAGKIPSICTRNLKYPAEYGSRLFLFNGVPWGTFLAPNIHWMAGYPGTGCCQYPGFLIWKRRNWRIMGG